MAPAAQDLAVLLTTRDTDEVITPAIERRILDFYYAGLARRGAHTLDAAEFMTSYRLCVLQHALKMIGRFEMFERNGKTGYRRFHSARASAGAPDAHRDAPRLPQTLSRVDAMRALVLAAGMGERLRPLTDVTPKPMLELGGHPLIHYPLAMLRRAGITDVAINLHHLASVIQHGLGDGSQLGLRITYAPEPVLLGTGGPLNGLRNFLGGDTFVIANSDTILDLDLARDARVPSRSRSTRHHRAVSSREYRLLQPARDRCRAKTPPDATANPPRSASIRRLSLQPRRRSRCDALTASCIAA